jgi:hypothetical protein
MDRCSWLLCGKVVVFGTRACTRGVLLGFAHERCYCYWGSRCCGDVIRAVAEFMAHEGCYCYWGSRCCGGVISAVAECMVRVWHTRGAKRIRILDVGGVEART